MQTLSNVINNKTILVSSSEITPIYNGRAGIGIQIKAGTNNTGTIYIGGTNLTVDNGYPLTVGDSLFLPIGDCSQLHAISEVNEEELRIIIL